MNLHCFFQGHDWAPVETGSVGAPALECTNCGKRHATRQVRPGYFVVPVNDPPLGQRILFWLLVVNFVLSFLRDLLAGAAWLGLLS